MSLVDDIFPLTVVGKAGAIQSSKLQSPKSKLQRNSKHQVSTAFHIGYDWRLKLGASLVLGCWNLVF
jgi:hypothetical protein